MDVLKRLKDNLLGTDEQNAEAKESIRRYKASKDREQTKKMRPPGDGERYALSVAKRQNKLAKEYEDMDEPKNLVESVRKNSMPEKLRKEADSTFKRLPEEVKDYEAYKDAGFKKGGKVSSASKRADGCAIRGKTRI